ncbi:phosphoribosylaminoimidazolesuccinocarboxamide synthase [Thiotrichales bacterium HSG1]|nr:phosphoribosylaminoimidazolesuccinocarboxamide synthase [Thiotrichales bacterium HSG1]
MVLFESNLPSLSLLKRGKVRDIYTVDEQYLLIVATDRISAYDVILPTPIPNKGKLLTELSNFWFDFTSSIIPNHLTKIKLEDILSDKDELRQVQARAVIVKKFKPLPIEAVVRGYLIGSGWKDYQVDNKICGITLPQNLQLAEKLPNSIYTPSTKAAMGSHDENITFTETCAMIGTELAKQVRDISIKIYNHASDYAKKCGIIIADTKFEFGVDLNGKLVLIDEVLTSDSSRFWDMQEYQVGTSPKSFDKQFVRDYLDTLDWNKQAPGPTLPSDILDKTMIKYQEAKKIITNS